MVQRSFLVFAFLYALTHSVGAANSTHSVSPSVSALAALKVQREVPNACGKHVGKICDPTVIGGGHCCSRHVGQPYQLLEFLLTCTGLLWYARWRPILESH
jgi:hypothetical protein